MGGSFKVLYRLTTSLCKRTKKEPNCVIINVLFLRPKKKSNSDHIIQFIYSLKKLNIMKKIKVSVLIAVAAMAMMSCGSLDSKISKYEKACKEGDMVKAGKIASDISANYSESEMTEEQALRLLNATSECSKAQSSSMGIEMPDGF